MTKLTYGNGMTPEDLRTGAGLSISADNIKGMYRNTKSAFKTGARKVKSAFKGNRRTRRTRILRNSNNRLQRQANNARKYYNIRRLGVVKRFK